MKTIIVHTQAELDAISETDQVQIEIREAKGIIRISKKYYRFVWAYDSSKVWAYGSSEVVAYDSSEVEACDSSKIWAYGSSEVVAYGSSKIWTYDSSKVWAYGSSEVVAYDSSEVEDNRIKKVKVKLSNGEVVEGELLSVKRRS